MRFRWPFLKRSPVVILPAALSLDEYRERLIGKEVELLAEHVLTQARFATSASIHMPMALPDGRRFELSVAAMSDRQTIQEPVRQL